jgi:flagellar biogenesis protein FliO
MRGYLFILGVVLTCAAPMALGEAATTRPAENPYENMPMPVRKGATTQAAGMNSPAGGASDIFDIKRMGLALVIVLVAIFVSHKVWKKLGMPGASGRSGVLQVVSRLSVSPKQQIMLVRVGRRLVLVGNSGGQMNSLCEIGDPEEAAALLGEVATQREESATTSFNAVLGGEEKRFEEETIAAAAASDETPVEEEDDDSAIATTRAELSGLAEKVRNLSNQFRRA